MKIKRQNCDPEGARGRDEDGRSVPQARDQRSKLLQLESKVRRARAVRCENAELKKLLADAGE
jgi:hypothetical protein